MGYRREIPSAIVARGLVERLVHHLGPRVRKQQRVAIVWRVRDEVRADDAVGTRPVVDNERLLEHNRQSVRKRARDDVRAGPGRLRHDDFDCALGPLCLCVRRTRQK